MEHEVILVLTILKGLTVLAGGTFVILTLRAYLKHRAPAMLVLLIAIALMTTAALAEGVAVQFFRLELAAAHIVEAVFTLAAFVVLVMSVVTHRIGGQAAVDEAPRVDSFDLDEGS